MVQEEAIAAAAAGGDERIRARVPRARAVLRQIVDQTPWLSNEDDADLDRLRWMAAREILELSPPP